MPPILTDNHQRSIDYLRLSVTDRCNLRCVYCMPRHGLPKIDHLEVLRYEEILRLVRLLSKMGVTKLRITGGEPLVRKDVEILCEEITKIREIESLSLTTNGVLLPRFAELLLRSGVKRVNISLDTLNAGKYREITRRDCFGEVWRGIMKCLEVGFDPVKLNVVVMKGINDDEIPELARLTYRYPLHVRFIEHMPFRSEEQQSRFLSADDIFVRLSGVAPLVPVKSHNSNGPARHYQFLGAQGKIGIISPISHHFCPSCNRLRITADGKLRTCLFADEEADLKGLLRGGATDEELASFVLQAIDRKPEGHRLKSGFPPKCINRPMVSIGG